MICSTVLAVNTFLFNWKSNLFLCIIQRRKAQRECLQLNLHWNTASFTKNTQWYWWSLIETFRIFASCTLSSVKNVCYSTAWLYKQKWLSQDRYSGCCLCTTGSVLVSGCSGRKRFLICIHPGYRPNPGRERQQPCAGWRLFLEVPVHAALGGSSSGPGLAGQRRAAARRTSELLPAQRRHRPP